MAHQDHLPDQSGNDAGSWSARATLQRPIQGPSLKTSGNIANVGHRRGDVNFELFGIVPVNAATGWKANDPNAPTASYPGNAQDTYAAHSDVGNILIAQGPTLHREGMRGWYGAGNVLIKTPDHNQSVPSLYLAAVENALGMFNVFPVMSIGPEQSYDGDPGYVRTADTMLGMGNHITRMNGDTADTQRVQDQYVGHPTKGFIGLDLEELRDAYTVLPGSFFEAARLGGPSAVDYLGGGAHTWPLTMIAATGGTGHNFPGAYFDGSVRGSAGLNVTEIDNLATTFQMMLSIEAGATMDGLQSYLFNTSTNEIHVRRSGGGAIQLYLKTPDDTTVVLLANLSITVPVSERADIYISYDSVTGQVQAAVNGVVDGYVNATSKSYGPISGRGGQTAYFGATTGGTPSAHFEGNVFLMAMTWGETAPDITNQAGINALYAADGFFRDPGALGVNTGVAWDVWIAGDETNFGDQAGNMSWNFNGLLPLANLSGGNVAPVAVGDTASTDFETAVMIDALANDTDADNDTLSVTLATCPDGTVVIGAAPDYLLTFTPDDDFDGDAVVSYTIDDGNGGTDSATVTVTVAADVVGFDPQTVTVDETFGSQTNSITIPATATVGQLVIIQAASVQTGATNVFSVPVDFTSILEVANAGDARKHAIAGKIVEAGDLGRVVDLVSNGTAGSLAQGALLSFDEAPTGFTVLGANSQFGTGAGGDFTLPSSGYTPPVLAMGMFSVISSNSAPTKPFTGMTPAFDVDVQTAGDRTSIKGLLIASGDTPADIASNWTADHGGYNVHGLFGLQLVNS